MQGVYFCFHLKRKTSRHEGVICFSGAKTKQNRAKKMETRARRSLFSNYLLLHAARSLARFMRVSLGYKVIIMCRERTETVENILKLRNKQILLPLDTYSLLYKTNVFRFGKFPAAIRKEGGQRRNAQGRAANLPTSNCLIFINYSGGW